MGEFEAALPFGVESIRLIASEKDLIDKLPNHKYDHATEYYVISNNIEEGVSLTRSIRGWKTNIPRWRNQPRQFCSLPPKISGSIF